MNVKIIGLAILTLTLLSMNARATLIDNGALTQDTDTGLEWLDLTETISVSYNDLIGGFGGFIADGFRHATTEEVCNLWATYGDDLSGCGDGGPNTIDQGVMISANATTLIGLLGATNPGGAFGMLDGGSIGSGEIGLGCINDDTGNNCFNSIQPPNWITLREWNVLSGSSTIVGHWLVRGGTSVPAPSGLLLLGLGCLFLLRRKI